MDQPISMAGVVLAGGYSSRMGMDKASLVWNGKTFLERQIDLLETLGCEELFVSVRKGQFLETPRGRLIEDPIENVGPMVGIAATLAEMSCEALWVIAVDLPLLEGRWMRLLQEARRPNGGAVFRSNHGIEPLIGLYPKSLLGALNAAIGTGNFSLRDFLQEADRAQQMCCVEMPVSMLDSCLNCNSPEDLAALRERH